MTASVYPAIHCRVEGQALKRAVAYVTVDYPRKLNILTKDLITELIRTLDRVSGEPHLRAVVLSGAGDRAFIGGADIQHMARLDPDTARVFITGLHTVCDKLRNLPVPVIARINGYCLGAGLEVAASCDMRVATEGSSFGMPEVLVGVPSVIEAALLPQLIGWGKTRELLFTGKNITAEAALRWGLVERVVGQSELDAAVEEWVEAIVQAGPEAIRLQKKLIQKWENLPIDQAIAEGVKTFSDAYKTDEPKRLMNHFLDSKKNRPPS